ncbi:MAG: YceI family protein [Betaproteobacteria bacterium]|nr:YceI family protein [Betaproteobacteria bacterium]MDE2423670.1 YceI family protein [Betaproteobacteria bacterium]
MKKQLFTILLFSSMWALLMPLAQATIIGGESKLLFTIQEEGAPVQGAFKQLSGQIHFDDSHPEKSHAHVMVELASIDFASTETEDEARGKNWFNVALFPQAEFTSTTISKSDSQHYSVEGVLSIKNIKKTIRIPIVLTHQGAKWVADGQFQLSRGAFQIGQGVWADPNTVADGVSVQFHVVFTNE